MANFNYIYILSLRLIFIFFQELNLCAVNIKTSLQMMFRYISSGASNRVPRKENKRAAKVGLTLQRKTMSS